MKRVFVFLIVAAALVAAGWLGIHALGGNHPLASVPIPISAPENLPDTPAEWRGRIDYRALDRQLAALSQRPEMAGLAVAVVEDGKLSFVRTYGVSDASTGAPVTAQTLFRWASVSKTATGVLAAALANDGSLDLNRPVASWGTSLRLPRGAEAHVTLDQLLAQRTGLTKNAYDEKLEEGQDPAALRASLAAAPLQCDPGTCHTYQNVAFDTASEILGKAANEPFADAVEDRFFRPLGMVSAGYGRDRLTSAKDWAKPHRGAQIRPIKEAYWRVPAAAGVESDIVDFAKWMQAMMGKRPDVLPDPVLQLAHHPRVGTGRLYGGTLRAATGDAGYGLGWRSFTYAGNRLEGHSGAVEGYRATMIFEPATRTGVVALWNSDWGFPFRIPFTVIDSYHKRDDAGWLDLSELPQPTAATAKPRPATADPKG
ncbi:MULTISPECIES: serine hydrolase [unclassified Sphingopyxis]|jgi:beta-lactamase class C|uniref:serine hydrolase domain-containing protein n=1 Tax=unclassified Sphingopyxis TaxID=2614943 RepID=UPI0006C42C78|nr:MULTISPECIES: serine hydrolase domain-containing protein [unclassified Sphingopyxis]USI76199.1 beta-lactamase family protein [Sphingopyxis sp. USTB-05]GAO77097.1 beta-lactamase [Sphingopyxis sp. C-1]